MSIGNNIRNIRKGKKMTLQQIANTMGCSPQLISQYESGKRTPKIETLQKIADALGVPEYELRGLDGSIRVNVSKQRPFDIAIQKFQNNEELTDKEEQAITEYVESEQFNREKEDIKQIAQKAYKFISYDHSYSFASSDDDLNNIQDEKQRELEKHRAKPFKLHETDDPLKPFTCPLQSSYDEPNDSHNDNSLKLHTNTRGIDWEQLDDFRFDELMHKLAHGENLTQEELNFKSAYLERTLLKIGNIFAKFYSMLNAEGQKKADEQIDRALEQVELLTKIPEYQKKPPDKPTQKQPSQ